MEWIDYLFFLIVDYRMNIFLVLFIIMWVCLKLYSVLDILGEDVLYFDIDSVIFKVLLFDLFFKFFIGNYLGELINEIFLEDDFIIEFVFGGFKNYVYRMVLGKEECKV